MYNVLYIKIYQKKKPFNYLFFDINTFNHEIS